MAVMNALAKATGVDRCSRGRHRDRGKTSHQREQQQKSGGQAMHAGYRAGSLTTAACGMQTKSCAGAEHNSSMEVRQNGGKWIACVIA
jgi:hypothetical protein